MGSPETVSVGLLGGSFDPVHNGHLAIAQSFLNSGVIAELWILLTPDPPHKIEHSQAPYDLRLQMLKQAFQEWENLVVSDVENHLPSPSYTLQTLAYLTQEYPNITFYLCMGEDSACNFTQWHKWQDILTHCNLLIARRPSDSLPDLDPRVAEHAEFVEHDAVDISSTDIRESLSENQDISELVPKVVQDIIAKQNLYKAQ